jgi:two-component system CitB family sensor kinase
MRRRFAAISVARQVLVLQVALVTLVITAGTGLAVVEARQSSEQHAREKVLAIAESLARSPGLPASVTGPKPTDALQQLAEAIRRDTAVDFVVIMSPQGIRYTHPNPARIGGPFVGHIQPAAEGRPFTETYRGTLGRSVRSVVPVFDRGHRVVALISVGITLERLSAVLRRGLPALVGLSLGALALSVVASVAVSRRLRRQTRGLGPVEITRLYEHHDAVLHAIREGLVVVDRDGSLLLANDEALRLLDLPPDATGRPIRELGLSGVIADLLTSGRLAEDEIHLAGDRVLAVNQTAVTRDGEPIGTVTTFRDHTELRAVIGELDSARSFAEALRASAHEASNRLHTIVTLIEIGRSDEAVRFATAELTASQALIDRLVTSVEEPALAALLLGKVSEAHEHGVELQVTKDTAVHELPYDSRDLVTVVGNLVDNAIDAAASGQLPRLVELTLRTDSDALVVRVSDSGPGVQTNDLDALFTSGWSTKADRRAHGRGLGLALVRQVVDRYGGRIEVANSVVVAGDEQRNGGAIFTVTLPLEVPVGGVPT